MKEKFTKTRKTIEESENILLSTHENPDTDGIASLLAVSLYLDSIDKKYSIYVPDPPLQNLSFLSNFNKISTILPLENFDLLIGFDYADFKRLRLDKLNLSNCKIITLDHHENNYTGYLEIIDIQSSSTSEIVYDFFENNDINITQDIGSCLYAGILEDTVGFSERNTTSKVLKISSELFSLNIDYVSIYKNILGLKSFETAKITGLALSRLKKDKETSSVYSYLCKSDLLQYNLEWKNTEHIPCMLNYTDQINFAFFLKDNEDHSIRVSFRSDPKKGYDVSALAKEFGGGGHKFKSATTIEGNLEEVIKKILEFAKNSHFSIE